MRVFVQAVKRGDFHFDLRHLPMRACGKQGKEAALRRLKHRNKLHWVQVAVATNLLTARGYANRNFFAKEYRHV